MNKLVIVVALAACGGKKQAAPPANAGTGEAAQPVPTGDGTAMSPEQCTAQGGQVKGDIGDGKVACAEGERDLGRVNQGIEGAVCCAPAQ
jgi:hypothetical protein